jgi:hypothetical protein
LLRIAPVDADGVALAAIKAPAAQNRRLDRRLAAQNQRIGRLERSLVALRR